FAVVRPIALDRPRTPLAERVDYNPGLRITSARRSTAMSDETAAQRAAIGAVLGRTPSGLFILTARGPDGTETGMLASWVQQASFEPPTMTVAVNRKRYIIDWLQTGSVIALSLFGESNKSLLGHFGRGF